MPDIIAPGIQVVYIFSPAACCMAGNDLLTRRLDSLRQGCGWYGNIILSSSAVGWRCRASSLRRHRTST